MFFCLFTKWENCLRRSSPIWWYRQIFAILIAGGFNSPLLAAHPHFNFATVRRVGLQDRAIPDACIGDSPGRSEIFIPLGLIPRPLGRLFVLCFFHFCVRLVYEPCKRGRNIAWLAARIACSEAKILRAGLSVLLRSSWISWSPQAKFPIHHVLCIAVVYWRKRSGCSAPGAVWILIGSGHWKSKSKSWKYAVVRHSIPRFNICRIFSGKRRTAFSNWIRSPDIPCENNYAERGLRPLVVTRKISYGSQSERGMKTREILTSVLHTAAARGLEPAAFLEAFLNDSRNASQLFSWTLTDTIPGIRLRRLFTNIFEIFKEDIT